MERRQGQGLGPGDGELETVRTWTLGQTEVERRLGAQWARREVRWRAAGGWSGGVSGIRPR